ncbi:MAG: glycosyltransferase [Verrucomicrobia bacterium]|nr:glycosyltransferase [Verrucomicrobiota bacterium]
MLKTICLNMIVKNESQVIERCLASVKPFIDYWVIADTGSDDGTPELIRSCLKDIPGELHVHSWVNFESNRNRALDLARGKADYIFIMDADTELVGEIDKSCLDEEFYSLALKERSLTDAYRVFLIQDHPGWSWKGVIHEYLKPPHQMKGRVLKGAYINATYLDGNRTRDPQKFLKDAKILEEALLKDPQNSRYVFYLAQSYGNAKDYPTALGFYEKRSQMGGDRDEVFWSFYCMGMIQQHLKMDQNQVILSYSNAHRIQPERAEPFYQIANYFLENGMPLLGYVASKPALSFAPPMIAANVHHWVYQYALALTFGRCALAIGQKEEAKQAFLHLIGAQGVPEEVKRYAEDAL